MVEEILTAGTFAPPPPSPRRPKKAQGKISREKVNPTNTVIFRLTRNLNHEGVFRVLHFTATTKFLFLDM